MRLRRVSDEEHGRSRLTHASGPRIFFTHLKSHGRLRAPRVASMKTFVDPSPPGDALPASHLLF